jgi:hypothetical protein
VEVLGAAVQIAWSGTLAVAVGPLPAGHVIRAEVCSIVELRDGKVWRRSSTTASCDRTRAKLGLRSRLLA